MSKIKEMLELALPRIAIRIQNELILIAPVDTGRLRNSIKVKPTNRGLLIWMVDYAKYVEYGTNPHVVSAKHLKRWAKLKLGDENLAYPIAKKIAKYGTRPNPFIRNTIQLKLKKIIIEEINKINTNI